MLREGMSELLAFAEEDAWWMAEADGSIFCGGDAFILNLTPPNGRNFVANIHVHAR